MPTNRAGLLPLYWEYFVGPHRRLTPPPSPDASDDEDIELVAVESILAFHRTVDATDSSSTTDIATSNPPNPTATNNIAAANPLNPSATTNIAAVNPPNPPNSSTTTDLSATNIPNPSATTNIDAVNPQNPFNHAAMIVDNIDGESDSDDDNTCHEL